jgi:hypothetical protein
MNREVHVRFWESPEVKVLRATRQKRKWSDARLRQVGISVDRARRKIRFGHKREAACPDH